MMISKWLTDWLNTDLDLYKALFHFQSYNIIFRLHRKQLRFAAKVICPRPRHRQSENRTILPDPSHQAPSTAHPSVKTHWAAPNRQAPGETITDPTQRGTEIPPRPKPCYPGNGRQI